MNTNFLLNSSQTLMTLAIVLGAVIILLLLTASGIKQQAQWVYWVNRIKSGETKISVSDMTRTLLDQAGLNNVKITFGLWYNYRKSSKTIVLKAIEKKTSLTAYAMAVQMVTVAIMDAKGDKNLPKYGLIRLLGFSNIILLLVFAMVISVSLVSTQTMSIISIIILALAMISYVVALVVSLLNIKYQKAVNKEANALVASTDLFDEKDKTRIVKIYKAFTRIKAVEAILSIFALLHAIVVSLLKVSIKRKR